MCDTSNSEGKLGSPKTVGGNSAFLSMYFENVDDIFKLKMRELPYLRP